MSRSSGQRSVGAADAGPVRLATGDVCIGVPTTRACGRVQLGHLLLARECAGQCVRAVLAHAWRRVPGH
jgi:hypothetical protein